MSNAKLPKKTSDRKRPNQAFILATAAARGYMTGNEKLQLTTLMVKNAMQRVNNRAMSDDSDNNFDGKTVNELISLIKEFVKNVDNIVKKAN